MVYIRDENPERSTMISGLRWNSQLTGPVRALHSPQDSVATYICRISANMAVGNEEILCKQDPMAIPILFW